MYKHTIPMLAIALSTSIRAKKRGKFLSLGLQALVAGSFFVQLIVSVPIWAAEVSTSLSPNPLPTPQNPVTTPVAPPAVSVEQPVSSTPGVTLEEKLGEQIQIKFAESSRVRLREGVPRALSGPALRERRARELMARVRNGLWSRRFTASESLLDKLRTEAEKRSGNAVPDLNNWFLLQLPPDLDADKSTVAFEALPEVEYAGRLPEAAPLPSPPDFSEPGSESSFGLPGFAFGTSCIPDPNRGLYPNRRLPTDCYQAYLDEAENGGIGARLTWLHPGGRGEDVAVCLVDHGIDTGHIELARQPEELAQADSAANYPPDYRDHGTASLGIVGGRNDGEGITGIAHEAALSFSPSHLGYNGRFDVAQAVFECAQHIAPGDVILIEQQTVGPFSQGIDAANDPSGQYGLVPVEWSPDIFDTIRFVTSTGRIVVEPVGNGSMNLDMSWFTDPTSCPLCLPASRAPFLTDASGAPVNDSGAIMVGAGFSPLFISANGATGFERLRNPTSNAGTRIDVQGWGDNIVAPGYGDLWDQEGPDANYTSFSGTSGASAIIAGAAAVLQGIYKARHPYFEPLRADEMRDLLKVTGTPQQPDSTGLRIGPLPNLELAANAILGQLPPPLIEGVPGPGDPPPSETNPISLRINSDLDPQSMIVLYTLDGTAPDRQGLGTNAGGNGFMLEPGFPIILTQEAIVKVRVVLPRRGRGGPMDNVMAVSPVVSVFDTPIPAPLLTGPFGQGQLSGISSCGVLNAAFVTGLGDGPYVVYTLDGSDPDPYGYHWAGEPTQVWTNEMTEDGFTINIDLSQGDVTIKAQNMVFRGSEEGWVAGEMLVETFTPLPSCSP